MKGFAFSVEIFSPILLLIVATSQAAIGVHLEGNVFLPEHKVLEVIAPEPEDSTLEALNAWREDAEYFVADLYRASGFFEIQVKVGLKNNREASKQLEAEVAIVEGPRYKFDSVRVIISDRVAKQAGGESLLPQALLIDLNDFSAQLGKPFQDDAMLKDRRLLLRRYGDAGYVRAEVDDKIEIRKATQTVAVDYLVDPSYPVIFDTLVIRNTCAPPAVNASGITQDQIIRDLVPYMRGDTVRISMSDKLIEKLQYTGAFNYMRFKDSMQTDSSHRSVLYLYAEEHVPGNARSSVFYETQYGAGVSGDLRHSNLAGTLKEARTGASLAQSRQNFYAGFGSPLIFEQMIRFDDDADISWYQDKIFHKYQGMFGGDFRAANSMRLTFPLAYWLRFVTNAELEAKSRMLGGGLRERDLNLNFIETGFISFLDQQLEPTRGIRLALTWGNGGPLVKGNIFDLTEFRHNWLEVQTAQYYYVPGQKQIKFATRLDGGRFFGEGASNSERFFLGGSRSVRSYDFQSLCLEKSLNTASGGPGACVGQNQSLAYYLASAEVRFEPFAFGFISPRSFWHHLIPIQIVPFIDYANVWDVRGNFDLDEPNYLRTSGLGYARGLGIRYPLLGIFNLRMDFVQGSGPEHFWLDLAQAF
jgi:outer membrane protein assembly factor BamA